MTILADSQIRALVAEKGMITPFNPSQIREIEGRKIISKGTGSYGYDVTLCRDIKIFSNFNAGIIDPKRLSEDTLHDAVIRTNEEGDEYFILPPNSYALGKTEEYFHIPKDVLVIALGKSTYARCFSGDTRIYLSDGTTPTFLEAISRVEAGERLWGYSLNDSLEIVMAELIAPRKIGRDKIFEVELDSGDVIRCTGDHKFITRDGLEIEAKDLKEGDSLFPFYPRVTPRGYLQITQPKTWTFDFAHKLADDWNIRTGVYARDESKKARHHVDHDKLNNRPDNIKPMTHSEHSAYHNKLNKQNPEHIEKLSLAQKEFWEERSKDKTWLAAQIEHLKRMAHLFHFDPTYAEARKRHGENLKKYWESEEGLERKDILRQMRRAQARTEEFQKAHQERLRRLWADSDFRKTMAEMARNLNIRSDITEEKVREALEAEGSIRGAARRLKCDKTTFRRFAHVISEFKEKWEAAKITAGQFYEAICKYGSQTKAAEMLGISRSYARRHFADVTAKYYGTPVCENHKVVSVRETNDIEDVYCLTAPEFGNFALASGVFVKNCGLVVNVTPIEPEFKGNVVIEIGNATSLPIMVYVNEGISQFIFFQGNVECDVSYADRGGKYQGQTGITLPRV